MNRPGSTPPNPKRPAPRSEPSKAQGSAQPDELRFIEQPQESHLRERLREQGRQQPIRPGGLCPHCGGHAFKRSELKQNSPCPRCGKKPSQSAA
jgi:predicted Zn-ribbon and HTH transcriptional regulator